MRARSGFDSQHYHHWRVSSWTAARLLRGLTGFDSLALRQNLEGNEVDDLVWAQWPTSVPRPTPEEWDAAVARYRKDMDDAIARGYYGDALMGLSFMMATYNREMWWPYFFPEQL